MPVIVITYIAIVLAGCIGWVMNFVKFLALMSEPFTVVGSELVVRGILTLLPPLGAIAGYF